MIMSATDRQKPCRHTEQQDDQRLAAGRLLREAVIEVHEAGMNESEILDLARKLIHEKEGGRES